MSLTCASFFAGVGGIDLGFSLNGFDTIYANEMDKNAALTYSSNFPNVNLDVCDIADLNESQVPNFDILLAGFPCQAFSIAGLQEGFNDRKGRGELFFQLPRIIEAKKPKILFFENVKNLVSHDDGKTFKTISKTIEDLGYHIKFSVLNACEYANIPQSRERIYIVCFKDEQLAKKFNFPSKLKLKKTLSDFIDFENPQDERFYYDKDKCKFYDKLSTITKTDTCYQWRRVYVRENKNNLCPTLTANMGMGGHNVPLIRTYDNRIRKLTARECFNLQGFPKDFVLPNSLCLSALYKQAGNSVVVPLIYRIAKEIKKILEVSPNVL